MLLLPTGPIVNFINHNGEAPNIAIRWSSSALQPSELFKSTASQVLESRQQLIIEYVALKEIRPGDEVFLDYGKVRVVL
jgi:SET domain-containing protein